MTRFILAAALLVPQAPSASALFRQWNTQYVGIQYWLQSEDGRRLTEAQAQPAKQYTVHLRSNVAGLLVVFLTGSGSELTPGTYPPYAGLELQSGGEFRLPGTYHLAEGGSSERLVFLFARSQTEIVRTSDQAIAKLARLAPDLVSETIAAGAELGTYVVHRSGGQSSGTIRLTR
jgi:hypothetical protein